MARPQKPALDYYSTDVNMDMDDKVQVLIVQFGMEAYGLIHLFLGRIYGDQGYYMTWGERERLLFARRANMALEQVDTILEAALKWGFFDQRLFAEFDILTSRGIQERFLFATKKRQATFLRPAFCLVSEELTGVSEELTGVSEELTGVNSAETPQGAGFGVGNSPETNAKASYCGGNLELTPHSKVKYSKAKNTNQDLPHTHTQSTRARAPGEEPDPDVELYAKGKFFVVPKAEAEEFSREHGRACLAYYIGAFNDFIGKKRIPADERPDPLATISDWRRRDEAEGKFFYSPNAKKTKAPARIVRESVSHSDAAAALKTIEGGRR